MLRKSQTYVFNTTHVMQIVGRLGDYFHKLSRLADSIAVTSKTANDMSYSKTAN